MRLPPYLMEAVQAETDQVERPRLAQAVRQISERYQADTPSSSALTDAQRTAYLAVRLPATFAAARHVLAELQLHAAPEQLTSILDLGAGPGTALFAGAETFPDLQRATLLEADDRWIVLGKQMACRAPFPAVQHAQWFRQDLRSGFSSDKHDLVMISYVLGELGTAAAESVIRKAWACAARFLLLLEPGTPRGFASINAARALLIAGGANILAPCPHHAGCPMAAAGDWCHFAQRVERTAQHRQLKGGALGYEDEKFSYLIAGRSSAAAPAGSRILRHPGKHSGHVQFELCTQEGRIKRATVTRSDKAAYKRARKAEWGDTWQP